MNMNTVHIANRSVIAVQEKQDTESPTCNTLLDESHFNHLPTNFSTWHSLANLVSNLDNFNVFCYQKGFVTFNWSDITRDTQYSTSN